MPAAKHKPTPADLEYIRANYGPVSIFNLSRDLDLSESVVSALVCEMGLKQPPHVWTAEECDFLRDNYGKMSYQEIAQALGMTLSQVQNKRLMLGLEFKDPIWTPERLAYFQEHIEHQSHAEVGKVLGLSRQVVQRFAQKLGTGRPTVINGRKVKYMPDGTYRFFWTPEEDQILRDHYSTTSAWELSRRLPGRTVQAILHRASNLKLKQTEEQLVHIRMSPSSMSDRYIVTGMARKNPGLQQALMGFS